MNFDGSNNFVEINHHSSLELSNLSISFWMKTSNTNSGIKSLIAKENFNNDDVNGEWWVYMNHASQNKVNFYVIENNTYGGVTHTSLLNDNIWHFVSITRNGDTGEQIITVDGQNPIFSSGPTGILSEPVSLFIGGGNNYNYNGLIDNVAIWNVILTPEELVLHMHCPLTGQEEGLVGYWNFNEGSGNTAYDISENGHHGVINGATFSSDIPSQNCLEGCIDSLAYNYNQLAGISDNSCIYSGCTNPDAINFDENATIDEEQLCIYSQDYVHGLWNQVDDGAIEFGDYQEQVTTSLSSLQQAIDTWNTTIDLSAGWNMFGYGCPTSIGVAEGLSNHTDIIVITKDNNGNVYMPEFGFNGIGDFTPGFGYQIKVSEEIEGFSLCDWYVNDVPEDNIVSLQEENASLQAELDSIYGCIDETACNYDESASLDDGSCYNNDLGCGCDTPGPIEGYDCDDNLLIYQVGDYAEGGIVFYVDETGQHGLVMSEEDFGLYWENCPYGLNDSILLNLQDDIGSGQNNTLSLIESDYINFEHVTAASLYSHEGYNDWFIPSLDEFNLLASYFSLDNNHCADSAMPQSDYYITSSYFEAGDELLFALVAIYGSGNSDCDGYIANVSFFGLCSDLFSLRLIRSY